MNLELLDFFYTFGIHAKKNLIESLFPLPYILNDFEQLHFFQLVEGFSMPVCRA